MEKILIKLVKKSAGSDARVTSGESGAVTLGALVHLCTESKELKSLLQLDESSNILLISTEGDTDPTFYNHIIGSQS